MTAQFKELAARHRPPGAGGMELERLTVDDFAALRRELDAVGWGFHESRWRFMLHRGAAYCLGIRCGDRIVGTAVALPYEERFFWINQVTVDPGYRRRGLANWMMKVLLDLCRRPAGAIMLDASPDGAPVYEKLGFRTDAVILRLERAAAPPPIRPEGVLPLALDDLDRIRKLDRRDFGLDRGFVFEYLYAGQPDNAWRTAEDADSYGFARLNHGKLQAAPIRAANEKAALRLLAAMTAAAGALPVMLDVPQRQRRFLAELETLGFRPQMTVKQMSLGEAPETDFCHTFAIAGLEFG